MNPAQTETKAFKGMKNDLTGYGDFQFSLGETYAINPKQEIKPCASGFHACINLVDCFKYYPNEDNNVYNKSNRFFEVTIFGDYKVEGSKICGRKIRIDKEINLNEVLNGEFIDYDKNKKFYLNGKLHSDGDLPAIIHHGGTKEYYKNGKLHRDGYLPAEIYPTGTQMYYKNGQRYRDNELPTIIGPGGSQWFYKNGELHRDGDLPAVIRPNGNKDYYKNGLLHRDGDLPAIINSDGYQHYYKNGLLHRDGDLPAVIEPDGSQYYYKNGIQEILD
jgi:antitoxin component YwqK of YwqJK toxin-antitoxin module